MICFKQMVWPWSKISSLLLGRFIYYMTVIWLIYSAKYTRNNHHHHHHHLADGCWCWYFIYTRPVDFLLVINEFTLVPFTSPPTFPRIKYCYNRNMPWNFRFNHKMSKIVCTAEVFYHVIYVLSRILLLYHVKSHSVGMHTHFLL